MTQTGDWPEIGSEGFPKSNPMIKLHNVLDVISRFREEQTCLDFIAEKRWKGTITCPHCGSTKVYKFSDGRRFKCAGCRKQFNAKTGTIFEDTKVHLQKWFVAIYVLSSHKKGYSSHQLARDIEVTQKTAWFLLHRIRWALRQGGFEKPKLDGAIEVDETFVGGKNKNRHKDKKVPHNSGRCFIDKTPVLGILQRGGELRAFKVKDTSAYSLQPVIFGNVERKSILMSDEWGGYRDMGIFYRHYKVDHGRKQYADGDIYTNTIEGFWTWLKRSIIGIYHGVSRKHLQRYVDEQVFKYNTRKMSDVDRFFVFLERSDKRLTHKFLAEHGEAA